MSVTIDESTVDVLDKFFVRITRNSSNLVEISINGDIVATDTVADTFNLSDNSYVFIGNQNKYFTGYDVIVDDILILDNKVSYLDTVPTDYLKLFRFYKLLYIDTTNNKVYGYGA